MALVDVDSWLTEYEACDRLCHNIISQISQREQRQKVSADYNRLTGSIHIHLKQFETELAQLQTRLGSSARSHSITFEETERRQRQVESLQSKLLQLKNKFTNTTRSDRTSLLQSTPSSWQNNEADNDVPIVGSDTNVEQLKQRQIQIMEAQNRGLEVLSQSISRQRELATQLGQEVEDQNEILENLADSMERVDTSVTVETSNIGLINRGDSTYGYWILIVVLFIAIVITSVL